MDKIFDLNVSRGILRDRKLYAAFIDLGKAYDRVAREALWNVWKIYDVGGQLMEGIKGFYSEANAYVKADGVLSDNCN